MPACRYDPFAMPSRKKKPRSSRTAPLIVFAVVILAGIWLTEQVATRGLGPNWLQFLFAAEQPTGGLRVGLIAGHKGNDSGAVCPDGLTEAEINLRVAGLVSEGLARQGIRAEILDEYDDRLRGYRAAALVSIHSDSCMVDFTGYKVASETGGSEASERLATCLWDAYEAATGLARHPSTITRDMTRYHAFREISAQTPGAIIELGFMNADRGLLVDEPARAAQGVVDGILCFLAPSPDAQ
jgi:N-acetylmuramoyl-L-alanine amidase